MKKILSILFLLIAFYHADSQTITLVREVYINESSIGNINFLQGDFDKDGDFEFIADANYGRNFFIGSVHENQIITQRSNTPWDADTDFEDLRYEDTNDDGQNEMYVLLEDGLVRLDTNTFLPIDTMLMPGSFTSFRDMYLFDVNQDEKKEWIVLYEYAGLFIIDPVNDSIISSNTALKGRAFHIANLDEEPNFELVLVYDDSVSIMDLETYSIEYSFPVLNAFNTRTHDLNHDDVDELFICDHSKFKIYYHTTKTLETYSGDPGAFSDFIFYNADADPADEIQLYQWNSNLDLIELETYPLTFIEEFKIAFDFSLGKFLDVSLQNQDEYIFNRPSESNGLIFYNPITRKARVTEPSQLGTGLLIDRLGKAYEESMLSSPDEDGDFFDIVSLPDLERKDRITGDDLFNELHVTLEDKLSTFNIKGIDNNMLVVATNQDMSIVDLVNGPHREFYYFIPSSESFLIDDLDFDGQKEFIFRDFEDLIIRRFEGDFAFTETILPMPTSSSFVIVAAQLNDTKEKEIILYRASDIYVVNSLTGEEIDHFTDLTPGWMTDLTAFSDGHGTYYLATSDEFNVNIHNYTTNSYVTTFPFENDEQFEVQLDHFQLVEGDTVETFLTVFEDKFQIYNTTGDEVYSASPELAGGDKSVLISDYDKDQLINIFTSTEKKLTEYEHGGGGEFHRAFYMTDVYPEKGAAINHVAPFLIQFSEFVDPALHHHIQVISSTQGPLNFTAKLNKPLEWMITPHLLPNEGDTIRILISGRLQSRMGKYLDINYDEVAFGESEGRFESHYIVKPGIPNNPVTISAQGTHASIVYADNIRHFPFVIESESIHGPSTAIAAAYSGIMSIEILRSNLNLPSDSVFDESTEEINVALNTFGLKAGDYSGFIVAMDNHGHWSDTFFFPFTLIEEGKLMDKNPGSDRNNSFVFDNDLQCTPYALKKILTHAPFTRISDVTGGDGAIYYSELPNSGSTGKIHKVDLNNFDSDWVRILPMEDQPPPLHLDNGFLYFYNYIGQLWEYNLVTIDAVTGNIETNTPYDALIDYVASPITDEYSLLLPGGSPRGYYSFNRWTGQINWFREIEPYSVDQESAATLHGDKAYIMKGRFVYALEKTSGTLRWTFEHGAPVLEDITYVIADEKNQQLFVTALDSLYAIDAETGVLNWSRPVEFNRRQPVLHGSEIIHFGIDSVRVFDVLTGSLKRQKLHSGILYGQPVGANGKIFIPYSSNLEVWDIETLSSVWSVNVAAADISVLDNYLILKNGNSLHIYQSENQCCNPSITLTEADILDEWGNIGSYKLTFDVAPAVRNNLEYHELLLSATENGENYAHTGIYFRSQDKKVYRYQSGEERLVFDYTLKVNDTFENEYGGDELVVTAIDSVDLLNGERRLRLTLNCGADFYWIENMGSTLGLLTPQSLCGSDIGSELLCYYENDVQLFMLETINTCWLMQTPTIEQHHNSVSFSPNPVIDELVIRDPDQLLSSFAITDIYGRILKKGNDLHIETGSFISGIYILQLNHKKGQLESRMFIKL